MARKLRLEYAGACYHVINRGNYRRHLFESKGAAAAFECCLDEACTRFHWLIHTYVVMANHFHLALTTPEPNLSEGMKWLQGTWTTRFNRFRRVVGRPFQGRYKAFHVEPGYTLAQVTSTTPPPLMSSAQKKSAPRAFVHDGEVDRSHRNRKQETTDKSRQPAPKKLPTADDVRKHTPARALAKSSTTGIPVLPAVSVPSILRTQWLFRRQARFPCGCPIRCPRFKRCDLDRPSTTTR